MRPSRPPARAHRWAHGRVGSSRTGWSWFRKAGAAREARERRSLPAPADGQAPSSGISWAISQMWPAGSAKVMVRMPHGRSAVRNEQRHRADRLLPVAHAVTTLLCRGMLCGGFAPRRWLPVRPGGAPARASSRLADLPACPVRWRAARTSWGLTRRRCQVPQHRLTDDLLQRREHVGERRRCFRCAAPRPRPRRLIPESLGNPQGAIHVSYHCSISYL